MTTELSVRFHGGPFAAAAARRALGGLCSVLSPALLEDIQLLVSELVTNSVRHGASDDEAVVELAVVRSGGFVRVEVSDSGPGFDPRPRELALDDPGGWGLYLVEQLTRRWGVDRSEGVTRVWFELPARAPDPDSAAAAFLPGAGSELGAPTV